MARREVEGSALRRGGAGQQVELGVVSVVADVVAGQGGQVVEQAAEGADRLVVFVALREALRVAASERCAGATGFPAAGGVWSV